MVIKAQSTMEYLLLLGIIVVVALIVVGIYTNFFVFSEPVTTMQNKQLWANGPIKILDVITDDQGNSNFIIQNKLLYSINFSGYSVFGKKIVFDENVLFLPEQTKNVFIPKVNECVGNCVFKNFLLYYFVSDYSEEFSYGGFDLIPGKSVNLISE